MLSPSQIRLLPAGSLALAEAFSSAASSARSASNKGQKDRAALARETLAAGLSVDPALASSPCGGAKSPLSLLCSDPESLRLLWALPEPASLLSDPAGAPLDILLSLWESSYLLLDPSLLAGPELPPEACLSEGARSLLSALGDLHPRCAEALASSLPESARLASERLSLQPEYRFGLSLAAEPPEAFLSRMLPLLLREAESRCLTASAAEAPRRAPSRSL